MFFNELGLYFNKKTKNRITVIDKLSQKATQHKLEPKKEITCYICTRVRGRLDETCLQPYPERWSDFPRNKRFLFWGAILNHTEGRFEVLWKSRYLWKEYSRVLKQTMSLLGDVTRWKRYGVSGCLCYCVFQFLTSNAAFFLQFNSAAEEKSLTTSLLQNRF